MLSLETCIQLKEAGFPQENTTIIYFNDNFQTKINFRETLSYKTTLETIACPSFDEIWALLPKEFYDRNIDEPNFYLTITNSRISYMNVKGNFYEIWNVSNTDAFVYHNDENVSIIENLAQVWLWLHELKLL